MEPIATYSDSMLQVSRLFLLYRDRVVVRARWLFKGQSESSVNLSDLVEEPHRFSVRNRLLRYAKLMALLGLVVAVVGFFGRRANMLVLAPLITVGLVLTALGIVFMVRLASKIQFVGFKTRDGKVALDIARAGPRKAEFEKFVDRVRKQIKKQQ